MRIRSRPRHAAKANPKQRYQRQLLGMVLLDPRQKKGVPHFYYQIADRSKYLANGEKRS